MALEAEEGLDEHLFPFTPRDRADHSAPSPCPCSPPAPRVPLCLSSDPQKVSRSNRCPSRPERLWNECAFSHTLSPTHWSKERELRLGQAPHMKTAWSGSPACVCVGGGSSDANEMQIFGQSSETLRFIYYSSFKRFPLMP